MAFEGNEVEIMDISKGRYWDNPLSLIDGCAPCSPGCDHCWSAAMAHRFGDGLTLRGSGSRNGDFNGQIVTQPERLSIPLKRRKPTVYAVWNDFFHEKVPIEFIDDALEVMAACPQHTFLVLTKRARLMEEKIYGVTPDHGCRELGAGDYLPNVWWGLTVCNQQEVDEKIPIFSQVPGKKFLSIEPALSHITLWDTVAGMRMIEHFDVVVMGAETGAGARQMDLEWAREIRDQCATTGVPFFLKQVDKQGSRVLDGRTHDDLPWGK
jgi:protein gp37